ncbi:SigB/SigF/SigG family RNA polymerase sigma factor [Streptacidiphilus jiangxiensis]|uniref:RNA polymerase sigma-B factor n=1 Tax=Streptacidiphilus jiangxiensis TaxID=235985 RepID=A0A1H7H5W9_STRJI|nr:SigB/SigF/SigG family RNA polymerase sigma factor [Streptacidiphilus jiangxiensis]SEK45813.1 RNA polymerase sigma-B factor [Streptacidiphilus jiangxiensis]
MSRTFTQATAAEQVGTHDGPVGHAPAVPELDGMPVIPDPAGLATADARELSKVLFTRLRSLEEGTSAYSYVRNTLVELNMALVRYAASRFSHRSEPMEDIVQVGTIGLIKAINRFDADREVEFLTYALPTITGEIKRFFRDTSWSVQVPRRLQELRLRLAKANELLEQRLDREPTVAELAAHLDITEAEVVDGQIAGNAYTAGTLEAPATADPEDEGPLERRLGYVDPALEKVESMTALRPLIARLPDRDRAILSMRFVEELTQTQIGERIGVSQMQVSRLLHSTLETLREGLQHD